MNGGPIGQAAKVDGGVENRCIVAVIKYLSIYVHNKVEEMRDFSPIPILIGHHLAMLFFLSSSSLYDLGYRFWL